MESLLFIEDDDGIRLALSMALEDEGYDVRQAPSGEAGLVEFRRTPPDLVLLDLRLPDMSGFDVCRALRAESIVPIIMITAQTDTHDMVAGLEAGSQLCDDLHGATPWWPRTRPSGPSCSGSCPAPTTPAAARRGN
jgi:DNA-binding response OmpR family regulator